MTKDSGIRSLLPGVTDPEEDQLQAEAKAAVMQRLDIQPQVLPAAMNERIDNLTNVNLNLYFKEYFTFEKKDWKKYKENIMNPKKSNSYKMLGKINSDNELDVRFDYHDNYGTMCCLPSFSIIN